MKLQRMVGTKIFKTLEDGSIDLYRILKVRKYKDQGNPSTISIRNESTGEVSKIRVDSLSDYTVLEADALLTFNIVMIGDKNNNSKDVIVTASKMDNVKLGDTIPYAVCRQSIVDIFYNLLVSDESQMICGVSINRDTCPANFRFTDMLACSEILYSETINAYRTDTLDDIYYLINLKKYDGVLNDLYQKHVESCDNPSAAFRKSDKGWCKDLKTLLSINNFQADINQMLGITDVDFAIKDYLQKSTLVNGEEFTTVTLDLKQWISQTWEVNIDEITVLVFDHDINLGDFNQARYFLMRDSLNILYLFVYTITGEHYEKDLQEEADKKDFSTEFKLKFYNKYNVNK